MDENQKKTGTINSGGVVYHNVNPGEDKATMRKKKAAKSSNPNKKKAEVKAVFRAAREKYHGRFSHEMEAEADDAVNVPYIYAEINKAEFKALSYDGTSFLERNQEDAGTRISVVVPQNSNAFFELLGDEENILADKAEIKQLVADYRKLGEKKKREGFLSRVDGSIDGIATDDIKNATAFLLSLGRVPYVGHIDVLDSGYHRKRKVGRGVKVDWKEKENWSDGVRRKFMGGLYRKIKDEFFGALGPGYEYKNMFVPKEAVNLDVKIRYVKRVNERLMLDTDGLDAWERQPRTTLIVELDMTIDKMYSGEGKKLSGKTYKVFAGMGGDECIKEATKAVKELALDVEDDFFASPPKEALPELPVLLDGTSAGVMVHEWIGHALEADYKLGKESFLAGREGKPVLPKGMTITSEPKIKGAHGSMFFDNQGIESRKVEMIMNGRLGETLGTLETDTKYGQDKTGHARAESPEYATMPRMTNIALAPSGDGRSLDESLEGFTGYVMRETHSGFTEGRRFVLLPTIVERYEEGELVEVLKAENVKAELWFDSVDDVTVLGRKTVDIGAGYCGKSDAYGEYHWVPVGEVSPAIIIGKGMYLSRLDNRDGELRGVIDVRLYEKMMGVANRSETKKHSLVELRNGLKIHLPDERARNIAAAYASK